MENSFFLSQKIAKPGQSVDILQSCNTGELVFTSSDESVGVVSGSGGTFKIQAVDNGETEIRETSGNCENTGAISLVVTSDWKEPLFRKKDYIDFEKYEFFGVMLFLFLAFMFKLWKRL